MGILISRGVEHLEKEYVSPRREIEVTCNVPRRIVLSLVVLIVEECRQGTNACYGCGKSGHIVRDYTWNRG